MNIVFPPVQNISDFSTAMDVVPLVYPESDDTYLIIDSLIQDVSPRQFDLEGGIFSFEIGPGGGSVSKSFVEHCSKLGLKVFHLAVDVNMHATSQTRALCDSAGRVECINGEGLSYLRPGFEADLIFCNPPYVPSSPLNRARDIRASYAGGERGREMIDSIFPVVREKLSGRGSFYLLLESRNDIPEVLRIAETQYKMTGRLVKERKIRGEHLFVYCFSRI